MFLFSLFAAACADSGMPVSAEEVPSEPSTAQDSPTAEEIKEEIERKTDPEIDAVELIEHLHGQEEVEKYRQQILEQKSVEAAAEIAAQQAAEAKAQRSRKRWLQRSKGTRPSKRKRSSSPGHFRYR
jgi:hypothetical protein